MGLLLLLTIFIVNNLMHVFILLQGYLTQT